MSFSDEFFSVFCLAIDVHRTTFLKIPLRSFAIPEIEVTNKHFIII